MILYIKSIPHYQDFRIEGFVHTYSVNDGNRAAENSFY